jgi:hypothetical protein
MYRFRVGGSARSEMLVFAIESSFLPLKGILLNSGYQIPFTGKMPLTISLPSNGSCGAPRKTANSASILRKTFNQSSKPHQKADGNKLF